MLLWICTKFFSISSTTNCKVQGPVVQSWISANLGLKFNLLFYLCFSARLIKNKTSIDPDKNSEEIFPSL